MDKIEKVIFKIAATSFIAIIAILLIPGIFDKPLSNELTLAENLSIIFSLPIILAVIVLVRNRSNPFYPKYLRNIGWIIFAIWILSLIIRGSR